MDAIRRRAACRARRTTRARASRRPPDTARTRYPGCPVCYWLADRAPRVAQRLDHAPGLRKDGERPGGCAQSAAYGGVCDELRHAGHRVIVRSGTARVLRASCACCVARAGTGCCTGAERGMKTWVLIAALFLTMRSLSAQTPDSTQIYAKIVEANPENSRAVFRLATLLPRGSAEAIALFERYIRLEPQDAWGHLALAEAYTAAGRVDAAEASVVRAENIAPQAQEIPA